jgi:HSP20 family protein
MTPDESEHNIVRRATMIWRVISRDNIGADPLTEISEFHRSMLSDFMGEACTCPAVNAWSTQNEAIVTAEVPGADPKTLNLNVAGDLLTIEGERKPDDVGQNTDYHLRERGFGKFSRTIRLPYEIEKDAVKASCSNGVLRITLPKAKKLEPKQILVEAGE